jgi:quinol monooxygenase YgiN
MATYLLSIRGALATPTVEAARAIHNQTAGAPQSVAAAKSLGDLSHMVYVPADHTGPKAGEFLILDVWNNLDGLNQFFANKDVQEQAGQIFSQRDPVVWTPAEGFYTYHLPPPTGRNMRIVSTVRGMVRSRAEAQTVHNTLVNQNVNRARNRGDLSHEAYFRLSPDGSESLEFFAVDVWMDAAGMGEHYNDPDFLSGFEKLFTAPPTTGVWTHPAGEWVEW